MSDKDINPMMMRKLDLIVRGEKGELPITDKRHAPPCFESALQYRGWLQAADVDMGAPPPARKDWPAEPNYCRDCTRGRRNEMRAEGRCLFPDTTFITVGDGEDEEIVGTNK